MRAWTDAELAALATAWASGNSATIEHLGAAAGLRLSLANLNELDRINQRWWGGQVVGTLFDRRQLLETIGEALGSEAGIAIREERGFMRATAFLAVTSRDKLAVAIGHGQNAGTTIGELWPELKPWFRDMSRNRKRADIWFATSKAPRLVFDLANGSGPAADAPRVMDDVERGLFDAVCADLASDEPRSIYADWLQERGDWRGELIALSLKKLTPKSKRRIGELRLAHLVELLGPLAELVDASTVELARGFLSSVAVDRRIDDRARERWTAALADPRWRTIEALTLRLDAADVSDLLGSPSFTQLRELHGISLAHLAQLAKGPPRPLETASVSSLSDDDVDRAALRKLNGLPQLQVLYAAGISRRDDFAWLVKGRARTQLRELHLSCYDFSYLPALLPDLQSFTQLEKVDFQGDTLIADTHGRLTILELGDTPVQALERLEDYPDRILTKVRVQKGGKQRQEHLHKRKATETALKQRVAELGAKLELH